MERPSISVRTCRACTAIGVALSRKTDTEHAAARRWKEGRKVVLDSYAGKASGFNVVGELKFSPVVGRQAVGTK